MMRMKPTAQFLLALFVTLSAMTATAQVQLADEVVAEVNGKRLTRADLEKAEGNKLLQARYQYYLAETKAVDEFVENKLLEMEAAKQKTTVDKLLDKEVNSKVADVAEEQLRLYFEDLNTKEPYEAVRDKIQDYIRQKRVAKLKAAYIQQLRTQGSAIVLLAPPSADFPLVGSPRLGPENAPVRIVEFADYECPYCVKVQPTMLKLKEEFGDKVAFYYKDLPLPMHGKARKAAEAARCAEQQGKFWEYHNALFNGAQLDAPQLKQRAKELNLDSAKFETCLDSSATASVVQKDYTEAQSLGLTGTPSFFINGHYFSGAVEYNTLRDMVLQQLTMASTASKPDQGR